jgi:hypothetical protein
MTRIMLWAAMTFATGWATGCTETPGEETDSPDDTAVGTEQVIWNAHFTSGLAPWSQEGTDDVDWCFQHGERVHSPASENCNEGGCAGTYGSADPLGYQELAVVEVGDGVGTDGDSPVGPMFKCIAEVRFWAKASAPGNRVYAIFPLPLADMASDDMCDGLYACWPTPRPISTTGAFMTFEAGGLGAGDYGCPMTSDSRIQGFALAGTDSQNGIDVYWDDVAITVDSDCEAGSL